MSLRFLLATTVLFGSVFPDPNILLLKDYKNQTKSVSNVENGANLYLASNDNSDYFTNIQILTGGKTHSLSEISNLNSDGTPKAIALSGDLSITSTNDDSITNGLTGYLYITTAQQASDPNFQVFVISGTHHISTDIGATVVVLNTQLKTSSGDSDQPQKTTYVTELKQTNYEPKVGGISFHWGYPSSSYQKNYTGNVFFENPLNLPNQDGSISGVIFDNVEPLQVNLDYWYFNARAPVTVTLQNKYVSAHNYNTTALSTTGLILNNFIFKEHVVNFQLDASRERTTGHLISTILPRQNQVNFIFSDVAGNIMSTSYEHENTDLYKFQPFAAQQFIVNASNTIPGVFYCQYFTFTTDLPITTQSTATPATTVTTTPGVPVTKGTGTTSSVFVTGTATVGTGATSGTNGPSSNTAGTGATTAGTNGPSSTTVATTTSISRSSLSDIFITIFALVFIIVL